MKKTSVLTSILVLFLVFKHSYEQNSDSTNITCSSHWVIDDHSFVTQVKWDISEYVDISTIKAFTVIFRQYDEDTVYDERIFYIPPEMNTYSYNLTVYNIIPYTLYEHEVDGSSSDVYKAIAGGYSVQASFSIPNEPLFGNCQFPGLLTPTRPSEVRDTKVISSNLNTYIPTSDRMVVIVNHVKLQWSPPLQPVVTNVVSSLGYELWIGTDPNDKYDVVNVSIASMNESMFVGEVTKGIKLLDVLPSTKYIYVKLRCYYEVGSLDNGTHRIYSIWSGTVPMSIITSDSSSSTTTHSTHSTHSTQYSSTISAKSTVKHTQGSNSYSSTQYTHTTTTTSWRSSPNYPSNMVGGVNANNNNTAIYLSLGLLMLLMFIVIIVVFIFALAVFLKRRKKFQILSRELDSEASIHEDSSIFKGGSQPHVLLPTVTATAAVISRSNSPAPEHYLLDGADEWELPMSTVIMHEKLGGGCFGMVYRGEVNGFRNTHLEAYESRRTGRYVAIKLLKNNASNQEKNEFLEEIELMKFIAQGHNPHVVNMLGAVTRQEPMCVVAEYLEYGDLLGYLKKCRANLNDNVSIDNKVYVFDHKILPESVDLVSFAYQIASGMEYLSSMKIIHRDLACRNVLVGEGNHIKISDFGLSRNMTYDSAYVKTSNGPLPIRWMAIESIMYHEFTTASDVWSFGITLWEIGTLGTVPYPNIGNNDILHSLKTGHRVDKPTAVSDEVYEIMLKCFSDNPAHRPTFTELKKDFDLILSKEKNTHDMYLDLLGENEAVMMTRAEATATAAAATSPATISHRSMMRCPSVVTSPESVVGSPILNLNNISSPNYSSIQDI